MAALVALGVMAGSVMAQTAAPKTAADPTTTEGGFLKEGTILYGGNLAFNNVNADSGNSRTDLSMFGVNAEANYFLMDNVSVGLAANMLWAEISNNQVGKAEATLGYGELVGRYHFPVCNDRLIPYVGAALGAGMAYGKVDGGADLQDTVTSWGLQAGFLVPLNDNVALDTCLKHTRYELDDSYQMNLNSTMVLMGFKMKL
jgi:outer membrane protein W